MEQIRPLTDMDLDSLYNAFNEAFIDYERNWTREEFDKMLRRRGYVADLSFGAFVEGRLVSFTLNGVGLWNGVETAYDTGTATIKDYRCRGLATRIFQESESILRKAGISQHLLEVLKPNTKAISVYTGLGFEICRELNYFVHYTGDIYLNSRVIPNTYDVKEIDLTYKQEMMGMWDFTPSWQNSFEAISRCFKDFILVGAFDKDKLIGYGIVEPDGGDVPQLAVAIEYRGHGIGSGLLKELLQYNTVNTVKVINTEPAFEGITAFLENNNIPKRGMQYEMIKKFA